MATAKKKASEVMPVQHVYAALADIMSEIGAVGKDDVNTFHRYNFRGIDRVYNHLHRLFVKHRIACLPNVIDVKHESGQSSQDKAVNRAIATMEYQFVSGVDGSVAVMSTVGEGVDSGDKATSKALAMAHKYALIQMFLIPTEDGDADSESPTFQRRNSAPTPPKHHRPPTAARPERPAKSSKSATEQEQGIIEDTSIKTGEKDGKRWTKYGVKVGRHWYSTFSSTMADIATANVGREVIIHYTQNGRWRNAEDLELIDTRDAAPPANWTEDNPPPPTDDDIPF